MDVLWQLQGEPTHATRERHRADRERLVRQPMIALLKFNLALLAAAFAIGLATAWWILRGGKKPPA